MTTVVYNFVDMLSHARIDTDVTASLLMMKLLTEV